MTAGTITTCLMTVRCPDQRTKYVAMLAFGANKQANPFGTGVSSNMLFIQCLNVWYMYQLPDPL